MLYNNIIIDLNIILLYTALKHTYNGTAPPVTESSQTHSVH